MVSGGTHPWTVEFQAVSKLVQKIQLRLESKHILEDPFPLRLQLREVGGRFPRSNVGTSQAHRFRAQETFLPAVCKDTKQL